MPLGLHALVGQSVLSSVCANGITHIDGMISSKGCSLSGLGIVLVSRDGQYLSSVSRIEPISASLGKLHLHPVTETHQFRPTLTYLDALSRKSKRGGGNDSDSDDGPPPDPDDPTPTVTMKKEKKPAGDAKEVQVSARRADDKSGATVGGLSAVRREMLHIPRVEEDEAWEPLEFCDVSVRIAALGLRFQYSKF